MADVLAGISHGEEPPVGSRFPAESWPDAAAHCNQPGYVRLGQGVFYLPHAPAKLKNIDPPGDAATLSAIDTEEFWSKFGAWGYNSSARCIDQGPRGQKETKARNPRQDENVKQSKWHDLPARRRWTRASGARHG